MTVFRQKNTTALSKILVLEGGHLAFGNKPEKLRVEVISKCTNGLISFQ